MAQTNQRITQDSRLDYKSTVKPLIFPTPFFADESLTSWLIRASFNQFCPPLSFTWYYWRGFRVWTYDIDKGFEYINPQIHKDIAILAQTDVDSINNHTLVDFAKCTGSDPKSKVALTWTNPLSKRNRYSRIGSYYCPECMDNENPYLSLLWRFSWVVCCTKHEMTLQNTCFKCKTPYQPQLIPLELNKINYCYNCREKISKFSTRLMVSNKIQEYQLTAESVYRTKKGLAFGEMVDVSVWFETLLFLINMVRKGVNHINRMFGKILLSHGVLNDIQEIVIPRSRLSFDALDIKERVFLLECSYRLMQIPLERWLSVCELHNTTQNSFFWSKDTTIPVSFMPVYQKLPKSTNSRKRSVSNNANPTSPDIVINHWKRIKRKIDMQRAYEKHCENN